MLKVPVPHTEVDVAVHAILESLPHPSIVIEPTGTIVSHNALIADFLGMQHTKLTGLNMFDLCVFCNQVHIARANCIEVAQTGQAKSFEVARNDQYLKVSINPCRWREGNVSHLTLLIEDDSDQKRATKNLELYRKRFSKTMDLAQAGTWEANLVTGENVWSDTTWKFYGLDQCDLPATTELWRTTIHPDDRKKVLNLVETAIANRDRIAIEYRAVHPDGSVHWLIVRGAPMSKSSEEPLESYIGIVIDITDRKLAEQEDARHRQHLDLALEKRHIGIWDLNLDTHVAHRTLEHVRIFGQDLLTSDWTLDKFLDCIVPEERPEIERLIRNSIQAQQDYTFECRIRRLDGEIRWILVIGSFYHDPTAQERHVLGIVKDVTETKEIEQEKELLQAQLLHSQKLEILGQLAGGIAHDFNNHLTAILGNIDLVLSEVPPAEPYADQLREIRRTALRSTELIRQLLGFARKQAVVPKVIEMNREIDELLPMMTRLAGQNIRFELHPGQDSTAVFIDPSQLDQILTNLCVNARDAISGAGRIVLETDVVKVTKRECTGEHLCQIPGNYVRLSVTDNGSGISLAALPHIFEPFFTTKEAGKGTGLGLSTVYGIVKQNHGYIGCTSTEGEGTNFTIYLPQHSEDLTKVEISGAMADQTGIQRLVLLVDDEAEILSLVASILEKKGYLVLTASNAEKALDIASGSSHRIDLLLTDIVMPGMNGVELSKLFETRYPTIKTLFMSGYTAGIMDTLTVNGHHVNLIAKPFTIKDLLAAVQKALAPDKNSDIGS